MKPHEDVEQIDESMGQFEQQLAQAMRPVDAPEGFADRVMASVSAPRPAFARVLVMQRRVQVWAGGVIAAALLVGAFGMREQRERRQREQAAAQAQQQFQLAVQITGQTLADARAQQQLEMAMQITDETLAKVRVQLQQSGIQLGD